MSTVLLVQSDPHRQGDYAVALEKAGYAVLAASDTCQGIARVREGGVDVVVVDGSNAWSRLSDFVAELERLPDAPPFVLVSSSPAAPMISARLGAAAFLPKPCTALDLGRVLNRFSR